MGIFVKKIILQLKHSRALNKQKTSIVDMRKGQVILKRIKCSFNLERDLEIKIESHPNTEWLLLWYLLDDG
jgi:hypothetical protein